MVGRRAGRRTNLSAVERPGPRLRRLLDVWGLVPGFAVPHEHVRLAAADGVELAGSYLPGPAPGGPAVALLHGFGGHHRKPRLALLAERLTAFGGVLAVDLRGHGRSGGRCTLGDREELDALAALAWLRRRGHDWVGLLGLSMGGAAVVRGAGAAAARGPARPDAVCVISTAARWGLRTSPEMTRIERLPVWTAGRAAVRGLLRTRVARGWDFPDEPLLRVARIAPAPLLIVHGMDDHYFGPDQAELLYANAAEPRTLWLEPPGFGHAEDGLTPAFCDRLAAAFAEVRAHGAWPERFTDRSGRA